MKKNIKTCVDLDKDNAANLFAANPAEMAGVGDAKSGANPGAAEAAAVPAPARIPATEIALGAAPAPAPAAVAAAVPASDRVFRGLANDGKVDAGVFKEFYGADSTRHGELSLFERVSRKLRESTILR